MPSSRRQRSSYNRYRDEKRSTGRNHRSEKKSTRRGNSRYRDNDYSSGSESTDSSSFSGSDSESDSDSYYDSESGSGSGMSGDSASDTPSGSSYSTPSSDSGESSVSEESCDLPDRSEKMNTNSNSIKRNPNTSRLAMAAALALQRRKKESPKLRASIEKRKVREVDYDKSPTKLYQYIEKTMWREAAERCRTSPIDAKTWVYRNRKDGGGLMWRMLPVHIAVLYRAPVYFLLDLLDANRNGPSERDDRNMLPIHMACRIICKEDVLRLLLKHHPQSLNAEDIKGRTPMKFLQDQKKDKSQSRALQKVNARIRKQLIGVLKEYEQRNDEKSSLYQERASKPGDKLSNSVSSEMSARPQVRMRKKNFTSSDLSGGRVINEGNAVSRDRKDARNPLPSKDRKVSMNSSSSIDTSIPVNRPVLKDKYSGDNEVESVHSHSSSRNGEVGKDHIYRKPTKSTDSSHKLNRTNSEVVGDKYSTDSLHKQPPQSNQQKNNEREGKFRGVTDAELVDDKYMNSSMSSERKNRRGGKIRNRENAGENETKMCNDLGKRTLQQQDSSDGMKDISVLPELDTNVKEKKKLSEPVEVHANIKEDNDDSSSNDSDFEFEELESLAKFWMEVEGKHDPVHEVQTHDTQKVGKAGEQIQQDESKTEKSRRKVKPLRFYEPPTELKKLLKTIQCAREGGVMEVRGKSGIPRTNAQGARRVNACGALKALAKKEKNRLRLARTKGVVSSMCHILINPASSIDERVRCSATLLSLCVPSQNWEAITAIYGDIFENFGNIMISDKENDDGRVLYNVCFSLFLLTKLEQNRKSVCSNVLLVGAMSNILTSPVSEDMKFTDGESLQINANICSPSDVSQQGSTATNNGSQHGSRMCILKTYLSMAKIQDNAYTMARNHKIISALTKTFGTMPPQENLLCMAIFTNLTRHKDNCEYLMRQHQGFTSAVLKGATSADSECKKCAILALQNLSCDKVCSQDLMKNPEGLSIISNLASKHEGNADIRMSALHTIKNLCNEPSQMASLLEHDLVMTTLCTAAKDKDTKFQIIACDGLATLSQWLYSLSETCITKNDVDIGKRPLGSMACTWDQWH